MIYQDIVNYIMQCAIKHIAVKTVKYQSRSLINAQNSNASMEFVIEDNADLQYYKTSNTYGLNFNIDIIGHGKNILEIQALAFQIGTEIVAYVGRDTTMMGILSTLDTDFLFLSHFTDDDSHGVRLSWEMAIPNPVDLCTFGDNFDEDNMQVEEKDDIDLRPSTPVEQEDNELKLTPVKLPRNK